MWKGQAFDFTCNQLWEKLRSKVSADTAIIVIEMHFQMSTMEAEEEKRRMVGSFCVSFRQINNLTLSVLLDREGEYQMGHIFRNPRPTNYLGLELA